MDSDFLVVGAGVIGLSSALELLQQGAKVTILERGISGSESSWAGGGILSPLCPWDYPDEVTRLTCRGAALFSAWTQELYASTGIDPEYEVSGMLVLPPFDRGVAHQWCQAHDAKVEENYPVSLAVDFSPIKSSAYSRKLESDSLVAGDSVDGTGAERKGNALLLPDIAQVRNPRLMRALRSRVEMLGGHIFEHCEVHNFVAAGDQVRMLATSSGKFTAKQFIVTAGAWSKQLLGQYALQMDLKPIRGQMLLFKFNEPPLSHIILQGGMYLIPRRDGHLLVGSTLEDVGFDKGITQVAHDSLRQRAEVILPQLRDMPLEQHWAGLRPGSTHNIPTIGQHPKLKNLYLSSGHFRYGVTMAKVSAEILRNEIMDLPQPIDVTPYHAGWRI